MDRTWSCGIAQCRWRRGGNNELRNRKQNCPNRRLLGGGATASGRLGPWESEAPAEPYIMVLIRTRRKGRSRGDRMKFWMGRRNGSGGLGSQLIPQRKTTHAVRQCVGRAFVASVAATITAAMKESVPQTQSATAAGNEKGRDQQQAKCDRTQHPCRLPMPKQGLGTVLGIVPLTRKLEGIGNLCRSG